MSIDKSELEKLPAVPALALAIRCAMLAQPYFENYWDDIYEGAVNAAIEESIKIACSHKSAQVLAPDGYADFCVDLQGFAEKESYTDISHAANAAAGAAYSAAAIADVYGGYSAELPAYYYDNIKRSVDAASAIGELKDTIRSDFDRLLKFVEYHSLGDYSPVQSEDIESGFEA